MSFLFSLRAALVRLRGVRLGHGALLRGNFTVSGGQNIRIGTGFIANGPTHTSMQTGDL